MAGKEPVMRLHEVRSIEIEAPYEDVFAFIADPSNLPRWAHAFEQADHSRARLRTPNGVADIGLIVRASAEHGTVDWEMTFPDGNVASAMSRLTRGAGQRVIYTFVLNAPPLPLERIEGALAQQAGTLELELATLRDLLTR
jgi:uncharacterized protein YndB with AHSA1/START domain